jgi:hypothetical protein
MFWKKTGVINSEKESEEGGLIVKKKGLTAKTQKARKRKGGREVGFCSPAGQGDSAVNPLHHH